MNTKEKFIVSVRDKKIKARVCFDAKYEVFTWKGDFEQFKAVFNSWLVYDEVKFTEENYILNIEFRKKDILENKSYLYHLPDKVALNSKHFHPSQLMLTTKDSELIENEIRLFFEEGKAVDYDILTPKSKEILEVLLFGYFTYKRFIGFIEKHFPEYYSKIRNYSGMSVTEILDVFQSTNLSIEELELELKKAISNEAFERAAFLRDKIKSLKS